MNNALDITRNRVQTVIWTPPTGMKSMVIRSTRDSTRPMQRHRIVLAVALLACLAGAHGTEASARRVLESQPWAGDRTPRQVDVLWGAMGDLNGDGVPDYVAIVRVQVDERADREERLVILAGAADGTYKLLSQSGAFCDVSTSGKFYAFRFEPGMLYVQAVWRAEGERYDGKTLQFRYNRAIDDLQLIGEEDLNREDGQDYKVSINFLTGAIRFTRTSDRPRRAVTVKARLVKAPLFRLQSYLCASQDGLRPRIYIDDHFKVQRE